MKKRFSIKDMTVKKKITLFSVIMLILMLAISGVGIWASQNINKARSHRYDNFAKGEYYLSEAFSNFCNIKVRIRNVLFLYSEDPTARQEQETMIANYRQATYDNLALFEEKMDNYNSEISSQYQKVEDAIDEWLASMDSELEMVKSGKTDAAVEDLINHGQVIADNAESELSILVELMEEASADNNELVEDQLAGMTTILVVVSAVAVIITLAYAMMLIHSIAGPIKKLYEAAQKIALGDIEVDCQKINNDDLGDLMDEFGTMAASIREQVEVADAIAKGDLTIEVKPRSDKDVLGKALDRLVSDENMTLNNIREAGEQITVGSEQVANASQALAQGATEQASALQEVTASMGEVTQRTKENATEASEANNLVQNIKEMAAEGNGHMKSMIQAMDAISESSETISKIIKTIDDIAFQTNILALNAAVEAARAGEHGKGFSVVAEEVRTLAAKSASAASETADMIEDSIRKIGNGTKLAETTGKALDEIVKSIDEIVSLISNITSSSNDQATAISQIDQAISQISDVVQTNAATSEQSAAASEELSNQAVTLKNLIGRYKLLASSGRGGSFGDYSGSSSYSDNEQIISLDGDFSKY